MRQIRTDMAMESAREAGDMPGVKVSGWENAGIHVTEVQLTDPDSAQKLGKPVGNYITLESEALRRRDPDARLAMSAMIGEEIARMAGELSIPVFAEGRINTPEDLKLAYQCGDYGAIVGSAITRPQLIAKKFIDILK